MAFDADIVQVMVESVVVGVLLALTGFFFFLDLLVTDFLTLNRIKMRYTTNALSDYFSQVNAHIYSKQTFCKRTELAVHVHMHARAHIHKEER